MSDFSRLSQHWFEWTPFYSSSGGSVSMNCVDCDVVFSSSDYSVHLRNEGNWWLIDKVNDRGQRSDGEAKLSTFDLTEKYLIWQWASLANSRLASGSLGFDLYKRGYAEDVDIVDLADYQVEVCFQGQCAILFTGTATIFSHILKMSVEEIERIADS
jgi:hypothetical protein